MATDVWPRPLADLEQDELLAVDEEWQRRAKGARPWSITEYLNHRDAVHARFEAVRRARLGRVAG